MKWDESDERWIGGGFSFVRKLKNGKICLFLDDIKMNWWDFSMNVEYRYLVYFYSFIYIDYTMIKYKYKIV